VIIGWASSNQFHRASDAAMHGGVGIAFAQDIEDRAVGDAAEAVLRTWRRSSSRTAPVSAALEEGEQHRGLHRARGVKPAVAVVRELASALVVVDVDADGLEVAGFPNLLDPGLERPLRPS